MLPWGGWRADVTVASVVLRINFLLALLTQSLQIKFNHVRHFIYGEEESRKKLLFNRLRFYKQLAIDILPLMGSASSKPAKAAASGLRRQYPQKPSSSTTRGQPNPAEGISKAHRSGQRSFSPEDQKASNKKTECTRFSIEFSYLTPWLHAPKLDAKEHGLTKLLLMGSRCCTTRS
jgi:hypothetical protein